MRRIIQPVERNINSIPFEMYQLLMNVLLASQGKTSMAALKAGFEEHDVQTVRAESGTEALSQIAQREFDLVVTDENLVHLKAQALIHKSIPDLAGLHTYL